MAEETAEKCTLEHIFPKNPEICLDNSFILIQFSKIKYFKWISKTNILKPVKGEAEKNKNKYKRVCFYYSLMTILHYIARTINLSCFWG